MIIKSVAQVFSIKSNNLMHEVAIWHWVSSLYIHVADLSKEQDPAISNSNVKKYKPYPLASNKNACFSPDKHFNDISTGSPAEIEARQKQ